MSGLTFRLSEGSEAPQAPDRLPVADATPLTEEETLRLIGRLPELEGEQADTPPFRLPAGSLPAPRPGETIAEPFPPPDPGPGPAEVPSGTLEVLRFSPEGEVPQAPHLSITFNQPMVPLTSVAELAARDVPVTLSPEPEGQWRWVGTQTLLFEPTFRFPMATEYTVEVPAGVTSANGAALAEAVRWTFATPAPAYAEIHPTGGPHRRDPVIFIGFDQAIDPAAVLATIRVRAARADVPVRLATDEEIEGDERTREIVERAVEGRWLALRPLDLLPYNSTITVDVGPGTPSAEGPRVSTAVQSFTFTTYGPLRVVRSQCGWNSNCPPMSPWYIEFSNPLDPEAFDEALVRIAPELPRATISVYGNSMVIEGLSQGRTTYQVGLGAALRDIFGQELESEQVVTFRVGSAEPTLSGPGQPFTVLDPAGRPAYRVYSINYDALRVRVYAVSPADWPAYVTYLRDAGQADRGVQPPGQLVFDEAVRVAGERDRLAETVIDLRPAFSAGRGHAVVVVEPEGASSRNWVPVVRTWVQATDIALDALVDGANLLAWATSLADGTPLQGVALTMQPAGVTATTGSDGLARLPLPEESEGPAHLVADLGGQTALLVEEAYWWYGSWQRQAPQDGYLWYVFDDRGMYRPGEEVSLKGWVRLMQREGVTERLTLPEGSGTVTYELLDPRGNRVASGSVPLNGLGGFAATLRIPEEVNLGYAAVRLSLSGAGTAVGNRDYYHSLQIQEFRRPEFEVTAEASAAPHFVGEHALVTATASYYAGGPLAGADTNWSVYASPTNYQPPHWDDFSFGIWQPWWLGGYGRGGYTPWQPEEVQTFAGVTDAAGQHILRIDIESVDPPRPTSLRAEASVMDVNRQAWTASMPLLVHPSQLYVGLRSARTFVEKGRPIVIDVIVTDLDGTAVPGRPVEVRAVTLDWRFVNGEWEEVEEDEQLCRITSADEPLTCRFETPIGGTYRISATVADDEGRPNLTQLTRWVSGGQRPSVDRVEQEEAVLVPDRQEYQPGDTAEILVQAPFAPAEGLLTLQRGQIVSSERFRMEESTFVLRVPITEDDIPNLVVQVNLAGAADRLAEDGTPLEGVPSRPAYALGRLDLSVPPYTRALTVTATPREPEVGPGDEVTIEIHVVDAAGNPVPGAEVALVVADEAVLALSQYALADPLAAFYPQRYPYVRGYHLRGSLLLEDPAMMLAYADGMEKAMLDASAGTPAPAAAPAADMARQGMVAEAYGMGGGMAEDEAGAPVRMRTDMNPLAAFEPALITDEQGRVEVAFTLPDSLTRYRVSAVAVAGERQFGTGESTVTARLPLMVRPSAPRFLNYGDRFELPVVLQNQTDDDLLVDVVVMTINLTLTEGDGRQVTVPARDRVEVRFPATTLAAGTARLQVGAASGPYADAARLELPVYTPATTEAFATYGVLDAGIASTIGQPVLAPADILQQFGGLEISTSSTALQALTDAVLHLCNYPYDYPEPLASRILAIVALRDVLVAFEVEDLPDAATLDDTVARDLARLQTLQNPDGGFGLWRRGETSWPFQSLHVLHALARAREKGYDVPQAMLDAAIGYARDVERHIPSWYGRDVRNTIVSYSLYIRSLLGDVDAPHARRLIDQNGLDGLAMDAVGWLYSVLVDDPASEAHLQQIRRYVGNRVVETAGAAAFTTGYREDEGYLLLASNRRTDAILLEALMADQPDSDLIPKIVRGLLAHRTRGHWGSTQENVFVLLSLDRYFRTYEAQTPEFVARAWLGDQYLAEFAFSGRSTDYHTVTVPMEYLLEDGGAEEMLVLSADGQGRLYYRLGMRYAPASLQLDPMDQGFTVVRAYEAMDDPDDVRLAEDGTWHIRAGARVRVRLTMVATSRRYHVALADPLPAGLEPLNPALAVTGTLPDDPQDEGPQPLRWWWWNWTWYEHQNLRDQRAEAFASLLWEGVHEYTYIARATTPGEYVVPPAKAEEMYSPEVFGRSGTDRVIVE